MEEDNTSLRSNTDEAITKPVILIPTSTPKGKRRTEMVDGDDIIRNADDEDLQAAINIYQERGIRITIPPGIGYRDMTYLLTSINNSMYLPDETAAAILKSWNNGGGELEIKDGNVFFHRTEDIAIEANPDSWNIKTNTMMDIKTTAKKKVLMVGPEPLLYRNLYDHMEEDIHHITKLTSISKYDTTPITDLKKIPDGIIQVIRPVRDSKTNPKIGNNQLCPCGSNKKYKYCCKKKES